MPALALVLDHNEANASPPAVVEEDDGLVAGLEKLLVDARGGLLEVAEGGLVAGDGAWTEVK